MKAYIEPTIKIYEFDCDIKAGGLMDESVTGNLNIGGGGIVVAPPVEEDSVHN